MRKMLPVILGMLLVGCGGGASNGTAVPSTVGTTSTTDSGTTTTTSTATTSTAPGTTTTTVSGTTTTTAPVVTGPTTATTQIINVATAKCLDVTGGPAATGNGVPIEQWTCSGEANEAWTVKDMGASQYEFIASNSGKCLTNTNAGSGTPVQQMDCTGQANQLWKLVNVQARQFIAVSALTNGICLSLQVPNGGVTPTNDGASVVAAPCTYPGDGAQMWAMDVAIPITYLGGNNNECLSVQGGVQATADGTLTEIDSCAGLSNQLWTIKDMGNRQYQFVAKSSGKCLGLVGGGTADGTAIQQSTCANTPTQLWTTENIGRGYNMIKSVATSNSSCLNIVGGSTATADGVQTDLTKCTTFELWTLGVSGGYP